MGFIAWIVVGATAAMFVARFATRQRGLRRSE
jgi:hypothetical protein